MESLSRIMGVFQLTDILTPHDSPYFEKKYGWEHRPPENCYWTKCRVMIFFIVGMSFFIFLVSRMITVSSAPYLLSGYNTMSTAQQSQVDIKGLVGFWQKFHKILALFILVFGVGTYYLIDEDWSVIGSVVSILLAYGLFMGKTRSFYPDVSSGQKYLTGTVQAILVILALFIAGSYMRDSKENPIVWHEDSIEFTGYKGIQIPYKNITEVELITERLEVTSKIEGLGTSRAKKGFFTVKSYGPVHLLVAGKEPPYLLIRYDGHKKLIYGAGSHDVSKLISKLETLMSNHK